MSCVPGRSGQWWTLAMALLLASAGAAAEAAPQEPGPGADACLVSGRSDGGGTAFVDVTVIPMDRERLLQKRTVLARECRIERIGNRDSVPVPSEYARIEGGDDIYLLPGLVEAHTHLRYEADPTLYLAGGVTTVRHMEGSPTQLRWREDVRRGAFGPRILSAGPTAYAGAATPDEVGEAVDSMAAVGYDFVKVFDPLPAETFEWLTESARRAGLPVAGHIPAAVGAREVLRHGTHQTIEHAEQFVYHWFYDDLDATRNPELAEQVEGSGAAVTPTMEVIHSWIAVADAPGSLLARPETRWLHPETSAYWHTFARGSSFENRLIADVQQGIVRELARRGVPLLVGTDMYMAGLVGPWALRREMRRMHEAGLSRFEVLRAATATPGAVFGYDAGTVEEGRLADLLLVRGNPLEDLSALEAIEGVMLDGTWHPREELDARLDSIEAAYRPGNAFVRAALGRRVDHALSAHRALRNADERRTDPGVVAYVASILRQRGRLEDAIAVYELALEENPEMASAHEGIARAFLAMGRIANAVARLERALEIEPGREGARTLLEELRD